MAQGKAGRPPKYSNPKDMQVKIEEYFIICEGEWLKDKNGDPMLDKFGKPIKINEKVPTVTGLALHLGFKTRLSLLEYQAKGPYNEIITAAKSRIEAYCEARLFDRDGAKGAEFSLRNNFKGWSNNPQKEETDEALTKLSELIGKIDNAAKR